MLNKHFLYFPQTNHLFTSYYESLQANETLTKDHLSLMTDSTLNDHNVPIMKTNDVNDVFMLKEMDKKEDVVEFYKSMRKEIYHHENKVH